MMLLTSTWVTRPMSSETVIGMLAMHTPLNWIVKLPPESLTCALLSAMPSGSELYRV